MKTMVHSLDWEAANPLRELADAELLAARCRDDLRGRTLRDRHGRPIGKIDALYVDSGQARVRFVRIVCGGVLGFGARRYLIPVDALRSADERDVFTEVLAKQVYEAPMFSAKSLSDSSYARSLYAYYGYIPFWTVGYRYPAFPYFPTPSQAPRAADAT